MARNATSRTAVRLTVVIFAVQFRKVLFQAPPYVCWNDHRPILSHAPSMISPAPFMLHYARLRPNLVYRFKSYLYYTGMGESARKKIFSETCM